MHVLLSPIVDNFKIVCFVFCFGKNKTKQRSVSKDVKVRIKTSINIIIQHVKNCLH